MSEYDFSPEAIEQHLVKQQRIARWVDKTLEESPSNPFQPLPSEHSTTHVPTSYPQSPPPQPQPAFYATPQGMISPTYSHSHIHGHSQRHNPTVMVPPGYKPVMSRSFSTPPPPVRNFYPIPSTPYTPYPTSSPHNSSPYNSPYSSHYNSPYNSPYQQSPMSHPSYSQTSFQSLPSSHIHANPNPVMQQQHGGNTYFQPTPPQPVVIVKGDRGYVVVPPPGHQVQVIRSDSTDGSHPYQGQYVFVKSKFKRSKSKKSKRSRRDSF